MRLNVQAKSFLVAGGLSNPLPHVKRRKCNIFPYATLVVAPLILQQFFALFSAKLCRQAGASLSGCGSEVSLDILNFAVDSDIRA